MTRNVVDRVRTASESGSDWLTEQGFDEPRGGGLGCDRRLSGAAAAVASSLLLDFGVAVWRVNQTRVRRWQLLDEAQPEFIHRSNHGCARIPTTPQDSDRPTGHLGRVGFDRGLAQR